MQSKHRTIQKKLLGSINSYMVTQSLLSFQAMTGHSGMRKGLRRIRTGWGLESLPHKKAHNKLSLGSMSIHNFVLHKNCSVKNYQSAGLK